MLHFILVVFVATFIGACSNQSLERSTGAPVQEVPDNDISQNIAPDGYDKYKWGTPFDELRKDFPNALIRRDSDPEYRHLEVSGISYAGHVADFTWLVKDNVGLTGVRADIYLPKGRENEALDILKLLIDKYGKAIRRDTSDSPIRMDCVDWKYGKMSGLHFCMMVSMLKKNTLDVTIIYDYDESGGVAINQKSMSL